MSRFGFILASAGSAIGLGNIWKFPGKVGLYGGGVFILTYILIVALIGLPIMLAEFSIGRAVQKNVVGALEQLNKKWRWGGYVGVINLFVIMSYYVIVGGWVTKYMVAYVADKSFYSGAAGFQNYFVSFITRPYEPLLWALFFLCLCIFVVVKGVSSGIEKVSKKLMPMFLILLIGCVIRTVTLPGAQEGLEFMFRLNWSEFSTDTLVGALGQAFFSVSVGMGILVTYGSYTSKQDNLLKSALWICSLDTLAAMLAALAIIPMVFMTLGAEGIKMGGGFAFMALPEVFAHFPGGHFFGFVFFFLLFLAALTSAISVLETCIAFMIEEWHMSRIKACVLFSTVMSIFSMGYSLSMDDSRGIVLPWFDFASGVQLLPMNAVMEKFTDNLMIPLGALGFCLFVACSWTTQKAWEHICGDREISPAVEKVWSFVVSYLAPAVIVIIFYFTLGKGQGLS